MQEEVRIALQNLKGIYDDGFMTKAEYESRRKALIDGATQLAAGKPRQTATAHTRASAAASKSSSVFSRLGEKMEEGKWGHEGFSELYGAPQKGKANIKQKAREVTIYRPPALRSAIVKTDLRKQLQPAATGDLRSQLQGSGQRGRGGGSSRGRSSLPEKCPW